MRTLWLGFALMLSVSAVAQDDTIPIVQSSSDSLLENVGTVTLSETAKDGKSIRSHKDDWSVLNNSSKSIVAFVETLRLRYRSGHITEVKAEHEAFFGPTLFRPGSKLSFSQDNPATETSNASQVNTQPSCETTVRWIEFDDGSTWGDVAYAQELLDNRAAILTELKRLDAVYKTQGADQFALHLLKRTQPQVDAYLGHLRNVQMREGTQKAIEELEAHLKFAEARPLNISARPVKSSPE